MPYKCPLNPPHVDEGGVRVVHKNRKDCIHMGLNKRGGAFATAPHLADDTPPMAASDGLRKEGPHRPEVANPPNDATPATADKITAGEPKAVTPKTKKAFGILKRSGGASPEDETKGAAARESEPQWTLSENSTTMFWTTLMSLFKGGIEYLDTALEVPKRFDTKQLEFTRSEEIMIGDSLAGPTTGLLKKLGVKTEQGAERFIHSLVIIRIFGRIGISLAIHFVKDIPKGKAFERWKDRKAKNSTSPTDTKTVASANLSSPSVTPSDSSPSSTSAIPSSPVLYPPPSPKPVPLSQRRSVRRITDKPAATPTIPEGAQ